jgi:hypothetical protein
MTNVLEFKAPKKRSMLEDCLLFGTMEDLALTTERLQSVNSVADLALTEYDKDYITYVAELCESYLEVYDKIEGNIVNG